jgi:hypothetical protein
VAEGVVPASLSCTQLLLSEARPGILDPTVEEVGARPARTCLSRTQLSLADARPGFLYVDGAGEAGEGAWRRVHGARYAGEAAWLRIDGASNGEKRRMDGGVGSSGGAAAAAVAEGDMADRAGSNKKIETRWKAREGKGAAYGTRSAGERSAETREMRQQQQCPPKELEWFYAKGFAEGERRCIRARSGRIYGRIVWSRRYLRIFV